jgi:internalin A
MSDYEHAVFISYAWGGEREEIVNQIDHALQERGVKIIRDKRDLGYKGSISEFMERIGHGNCVIVVISDKYLRSPNCMFELMEIAEAEQLHDRIFPIVLADANIYDPLKRIDYVRHWEAKRGELANAIRTLDPANLQGIREDMDLYDRIRNQISGLTSILKDMNTFTPDMHWDANFSDVYDGIMKQMRGDLPVATSANADPEETQPAAGTKPLTNVSATNNIVAFGRIQIGGNVEGNISIGTDNQSDNQ